MVSKIEKTNFGFTSVNKALKQKLVNEVFSNVADKYDIMNDVMSFGLHRFWKKILVNAIKVKPNTKIIDMAAGTGDIAFKILEKFQIYGEDTRIILADINLNMLKQAENRAIDMNLPLNSLEFIEVNAEATKFPDNHFDYYVISYGIRNFTNYKKALKEAYRVLKPGGKFLCLEFSSLDEGILAKFYDYYSFNIIPQFGKIITGDDDPYKYFVESIRIFPKPYEFDKLIQDAGFKETEFKNLSKAITTLYMATK